MYRGYIFASLAGTYTFTMATPDDTVFLWLGDLAKTGWNKNNANIHTIYNGPITTVSFTVPIEGTYIPVRIVNANNGPESMNWAMTMKDPYGLAYSIGTSTAASNNLLRFSCDGTSGPAWPNAIGQEDTGPNAYVATPTTCNNQGLDYGSFVHNQGGGSTFNPGFMKAVAAGGVGPGTPTTTAGAQ
jgi:hypothetical protein